jgi:hypothetical protein
MERGIIMMMVGLSANRKRILSREVHGEESKPKAQRSSRLDVERGFALGLEEE